METLLHEFLEWLKSQSYSSNSQKNYLDDTQQFLHWYTATTEAGDLMKVDRSLMQQYRDQLLDFMQPSSVCRHLSSLKLFLNCAEGKNWINVNPLHLVKFPEIPPKPPELLSPKEVDDLLEAPSDDHYLGMRDRAMLELLYSSGLKVHELLDLNTSDLFLDLGFLKVRGRRERMVPVTLKAIKVLNKYLKEGRQDRLRYEEDTCLFPNRNGERMTRIGFWFMIKKHSKRAGIQSRINARILRHSFAAHLLENGMDLTDLAQLFGFVSLDATLQYAHINRPNYFEVYRRCHPGIVGTVNHD
jgi:integrase/recombinase XerD